MSQKLILLLSFLSVSGCAQNKKIDNSIVMNNKPAPDLPKTQLNTPAGMETIVLGGGCFWCTEAVFQDLNGVTNVQSGYSGGHQPNPGYKEVCGGNTGHAEVIKITYDPKIINTSEILDVFWQVHDPTTLNRQGADVGTQYRSAIFYTNEEQHSEAEKLKKELDANGVFSSPIVTELTPFTNFYPAEDYHNNYYNQNGEQPYCRLVVKPKVDKFRKVFKDKLKAGARE